MGRIWVWTVGVTLLASTFGSATASSMPEVAGEWETAVEVECADACATERSPLTFNVESTLALDVHYGALTLSLTNIWDLRGLLEATLDGEVDLPLVIEPSITFAPPLEGDRRIPPGHPLLVRSRIDTDVRGEGVELALGVVTDDVTFERLDDSVSRYGPSEQRFRTGAVAEIGSETPGGVELSAETGWCFDPDGRFYVVDGYLSGEVCASSELAWTKARLAIEELPLSASVEADGELDCESADAVPGFGCEVDAEARWASPGGALTSLIEEATVSAAYDNVFPHRELDDVEIELVRHPIQLTWTLDEDLAWDRLNVEGERAVHRGDAVLTGDFYSTIEPDEGLTYLRLGGDVERGPTELGGDVRWREADDHVRFDELALGVDLEPTVPPLELELDLTFDVDGLGDVELDVTLDF